MASRDWKFGRVSENEHVVQVKDLKQEKNKHKQTHQKPLVNSRDWKMAGGLTVNRKAIRGKASEGKENPII